MILGNEESETTALPPFSSNAESRLLSILLLIQCTTLFNDHTDLLVRKITIHRFGRTSSAARVSKLPQADRDRWRKEEFDRGSFLRAG